MPEIADVALRLIGAFYVFAGFVASRATLTTYLLDRAIAAISAKRPTNVETARTVWLLVAAFVILAGGVALMLGLEWAAPLFAVSAAAQAAYIFVVAPRYFDVDDPPSPAGRRQTTNAFVVYLAATAFVAWAFATDRLTPWQNLQPPLLAAGAAAVIAHATYILRQLYVMIRPSAPGATLETDDTPEPDAPALDPAAVTRVKVMAEFGYYPLWSMDEGVSGDINPSDLGLSAELTAAFDAWAQAYATSLDPDDPGHVLWTPADNLDHAQEGRRLAARLAAERPDLTVFIHEDGAEPVAVDPPGRP